MWYAWVANSQAPGDDPETPIAFTKYKDNGVIRHPGGAYIHTIARIHVMIYPKLSYEYSLPHSPQR